MDDFFNHVIMGEDLVRSYYRLLYVFKNIADKHGLEFFMHSETMLGAVRHRGMIPWHDNVHVMVEEFFEEKVEKIVPELENMGISLKPQAMSGLFHFFCSDKTSSKICEEDTHVQLELIISRREVIGGKTVLCYKTKQVRESFHEFILLEDVYPLLNYDFGPLKVKGIRDCREHFFRNGFKTDEAVVTGHANTDELLHEIKQLVKQGVYPIRDEKYLCYCYDVEMKEIDMSESKICRTVLTYGTFDLFHPGHVNLLRKLRALGDKLIVGLSTDSFNSMKGKQSFYSYEERKKILLANKYVSKVIPEENWEQKVKDIKKHGVHIFGMGNDWQGKFDYLQAHCKVVYFDRTKDISTTKIKKCLSAVNAEKLKEVEISLKNTLDIVLMLASSVGAKKE